MYDPNCPLCNFFYIPSQIISYPNEEKSSRFWGKDKKIIKYLKNIEKKIDMLFERMQTNTTTSEACTQTDVSYAEASTQTEITGNIIGIDNLDDPIYSNSKF